MLTIVFTLISIFCCMDPCKCAWTHANASKHVQMLHVFEVRMKQCSQNSSPLYGMTQRHGTFISIIDSLVIVRPCTFLSFFMFTITNSQLQILNKDCFVMHELYCALFCYNVHWQTYMQTFCNMWFYCNRLTFLREAAMPERSWQPQLCPSVCHTRAWHNEKTYCQYFDTVWKRNHSSFLTPAQVGGRCPFPPEIWAWIDPPPLKNADFDQYLLITSQP